MHFRWVDFSRKRFSDRVEMAAGDVVQTAPLRAGRFKVPMPIAEHTIVGPGRGHLTDEQVVGIRL